MIFSRAAARALANTTSASRSPARGRRIARLTRRGWVLLVIGAVVIPLSYWLGRRELLYLGSFLVLLPLLALAFVRLRRMRLSVRRSFSPAVVSVGHPTMADVQVGNLAPSSTTEANWRDSWPWYPYATEPLRLPGLRPSGTRSAGQGSTAHFRYEVTPPTRGVFDVGPMLVDFADPFGLADGALVAGATEPLTVTPEIVALVDGIVSISADEGPTRVMQRRALGGEDDLMAREYRRGDALRRVHWRASAHAGQLMVRQEEQRSHAEARILLDTRLSNYRDVATVEDIDSPRSEAFEWAVTFTASLGVHLVRNGFLVQVIETAPAQLSSPEHPDEFLESLASVALSAASPEELSLLHGVQRPDRSQGSVFAVLSDADPATVDRLGAQRQAFDLAVAFLVAPQQFDLERTLADAGWLCVTVQVDDPIDSAWAALGARQAGPALSAERAGTHFESEGRV
jgi:uncharacterized protein (DUF58 family)